MMLPLLAGNENRPVGCWAGPEALPLLGGNEIAPGGATETRQPAGVFGYRLGWAEARNCRLVFQFMPARSGRGTAD